MSLLVYIMLFVTLITKSKTDLRGLKDLKWGKRMSDFLIDVLDKISFLDCVDECVTRKRCKSVSYRRTGLRCELSYQSLPFNAGSSSGNPMLQDDKSYLFTENLYWDSRGTVACSTHSCAVNEKSVRNSLNTCTCEITDCGFLSQLHSQYEEVHVSGSDKYRLIGVGARRKVNCKAGYQQMDIPASIVCRPDGVWTQPSIQCTALECKITTNGEKYRGHTTVTDRGLTCQRWDKQVPHAHTRDMMLDGPAALHENYCRNPDSESEGPWCYTTDNTTRWQYCDIPLCVNVRK